MSEQLTGQVIGSYRIIDKIGAGGMGEVYSAEHTLIGRRAAVKVLLPQYSSHKDIVTRFFNEARAATAELSWAVRRARPSHDLERERGLANDVT